MAKQATKRTVIDRLRTAFKAKDEAAFEEELGNASEELEAGGEEPQKVVIELRQPEVQAAGEEAVEKALDPPAVEEDEGDDPMVALNAKIDDILTRLAALEKTDERAHEEAAEPDGDEVTMDGEDEDEEKKDDDKDEEKKVMDAATVKTVRAEFQDTLARAEVLSPGIKVPSFDSKKSRKTIADSMCGLRRKAMKQALGDGTRGKIVRGVIGDSDPMKMSCDALTVAFRASSELVAAKNSTSKALDHRTFPQGLMTAERYQQMIIDNRRGGKSA